MVLTPKPTADAPRDPNTPDPTSRNESNHPYKSKEEELHEYIRAIFGSRKMPDRICIHEGHVTVGGGQHNGQIRHLGSDSLQADPEPSLVIYSSCVQAGNGDQHNGDIVYVTEGGGKTSTTTTMYNNMICGSTKMSDNLPDGNREIKGTQHNGPIIKLGKKPDFE